MELSSLARTLAERLIAETDNFGDCSLEIAMQKAEAVIREAIDKTLDESVRKIRAFDKDDVSSDRGIGYDECIEAIRSLRKVQTSA